MACFASRLLQLDELVPQPPPPPPVTRPSWHPAALGEGLARVPRGVWLGLLTALAHFSLPLMVFSEVTLGVYLLLLGAIVTSTARPVRRLLWRYPRPSSLAEPEQHGLWGEIKVLRQLTRLGDEFVVLHDVVLPAPHGETQVDLIVLGPGGATCVEVKAWRGRVYGQRVERLWTQVKRYGHQVVKDRRGNPLEQNLYHCQALRAYLQQFGYALPVHSLVVFTAADLRIETAPEVVDLAEVTAAFAQQTPHALLTPEVVTALARELRARLALSLPGPGPSAAPTRKSPGRGPVRLGVGLAGLTFCGAGFWRLLHTPLSGPSPTTVAEALTPLVVTLAALLLGLRLLGVALSPGGRRGS